MSEGPPPSAVLHRLTAGHWIARAVCTAAELGLADQMSEAPRAVAELAERVGADPRALHRLLRALASVGVFTEPSPRCFALTPVGACLRADHPNSLRALALTIDQVDWQAWAELRHSVRTGEPAFQRVHGVAPFDYFRLHPSVGENFDAAMTGFVLQNGAAIVEAYDFSSVSRLVDVGGGVGTLMTLILRAHPQMTGVVFDLPEVIPRAERRVAQAGLSARCECVAGSFFDRVPTGGDAYLLASIIHDWDGESCQRILAACRAAMPSRARLLLVEMVIPQGDGDFFGKLLDLNMLVSFGGQERTEAEYSDLLTLAGFRLTQVIPTRTPSSIVEAIPC